MASRNNIAEIAIVAVSWSLAAIVTFYAIRVLGGTTLIWIPVGIATAALFGMPYRRWAQTVAVLIACAVPIHLVFDFTVAKAVGYTAGGMLCSVAGAYLARVSLRNRRLDNLEFRDFLFLSLSAGAGSLAGTIVAGFFWDEVSWLLIGWWMFANWLGIMLVSPTVIAARARFHWNRHARLTVMRLELSASLFFLFCLSAAISWWALHETRVPLMFLVALVVVFASSRHGQLGTTVTLFAFALIGTVSSIVIVPMTLLAELPRLDRAFALQSFMGIVLVVGLHLSRRLMQVDRLSAGFESQNRILAQNNAMFRLAERLSGVGRWQFFHKTRRQIWSQELCTMHGLPPGCRPDRVLRSKLYPDSLEVLHAGMNRHAASREPYRIELDMVLPSGEARVMCLLAQNEFAPDGSLEETFAVVSDVTDHYREVEQLAQEKGQALQQAEEAQQLALTDPLTGLPNRRRAMAEIDRTIIRYARAGKPLSLVVFDLDHFKSVNDTYGHQAGDSVLVRIARIATAQCRPNDLVGRIGGEEFIWVLPGATPAVARKAAERLRGAIEEYAGDGPEITASVGYATWATGDSGLTLFARADAALYDAKNSGRNVIKMAA